MFSWNTSRWPWRHHFWTQRILKILNQICFFLHWLQKQNPFLAPLSIPKPQEQWLSKSPKEEWPQRSCWLTSLKQHKVYFGRSLLQKTQKSFSNILVFDGDARGTKNNSKIPKYAQWRRRCNSSNVEIWNFGKRISPF